MSTQIGVNDTPELTVVIPESPAIVVAVNPEPPLTISVLDRGIKGDPSTVPGPPGEQGIQGPPGPAGSAGGASGFTHNQDVPASIWNVVHNLGRRPSVTVIDSANDEVLPDPYYQDINTVVLTFGAPFSGIAYLI